MKMTRFELLWLLLGIGLIILAFKGDWLVRIETVPGPHTLATPSPERQAQ